MIQATAFFDPRKYPKSGFMEVIGGPLDGDRWPCTQAIPRQVGGFYAYGDTDEWSYVWVPAS